MSGATFNGGISQNTETGLLFQALQTRVCDIPVTLDIGLILTPLSNFNSFSLSSCCSLGSIPKLIAVIPYCCFIGLWLGQAGSPIHSDILFSLTSLLNFYVNSLFLFLLFFHIDYSICKNIQHICHHYDIFLRNLICYLKYFFETRCIYKF